MVLNSNWIWGKQNIYYVKYPDMESLKQGSSNSYGKSLRKIHVRWKYWAIVSSDCDIIQSSMGQRDLLVLCVALMCILPETKQYHSAIKVTVP